MRSYLKYFINCAKDGQRSNPYGKMSKIIPVIFRLIDTFETNSKAYYEKAFPNKKYGDLKNGAAPESRDYVTTFGGVSLDFRKVNKGYITPMIGGFRSLIREQDGKYEFKVDPLKVLDDCGVELMQMIGGALDAHTFGNNEMSWKMAYKIVESASKKFVA
jgi:hypothetical protein